MNYTPKQKLARLAEINAILLSPVSTDVNRDALMAEFAMILQGVDPNQPAGKPLAVLRAIAGGLETGGIISRVNVRDDLNPTSPPRPLLDVVREAIGEFEQDDAATVPTPILDCQDIVDRVLGRIDLARKQNEALQGRLMTGGDLWARHEHVDDALADAVDLLTGARNG